MTFAVEVRIGRTLCIWSESDTVLLVLGGGGWGIEELTIL